LNYPPAIYLFHGIFSFIFNNVLGFSGFNLLILKLPYLIFDLLTGLILLKIFESPKKGFIAFTLWMFNPINLYATYMMGQFDIILSFFIILSILLFLRGKLSLSALALGGGIAFKLSPIFLVIPLLIYGKGAGEKMKLFFLALTPYLLTIIPYLPSYSFRATALLANQSSKSLYANLPVSGGESILLFPALLLLFYLIILRSKIKTEIWKLYAIPLLLFFIFTHYHPQWLIWLTPLLILDLAKYGLRNWLPITLILFSWFASLFFFDSSLTVGIFTPLFPQLGNLPSIWELLRLSPDYNLSRSLLQTIFAAAGFYLIYEYFHTKSND